ncbi:hypothetical protein SacmaDRAFT_0224 [Saccharomonospora marina XMU15]|uniref:Uncharacterized protein n=1 Tax=Saccharomonospora marina XMU15 TaxID=882083 RepID=H5X074_9PSEU|nr:hypothetical protein [Saccharomonospora marina]EHR48534.1 hypothetical protein SacmaDRAFT_0224 [Saccharomonospora marina XMU15]
MEFVHSITAGRAATGTAPFRRPALGEKPRQSLSSTPTVDARGTSGRRYEGGQVVWRVQCGDLISRERCVTVFVDEGEVVLVGPPGETARLTAGQLGQLRAALNEAAKLAER